MLNRCRCPDCARAHTDYESERARRLEPAFVGAGPAREHVRMLADHAVGLKQIAKVSGVGHGTLWKLIYGVPGRGPSKRVRKTTLDRILSVSPADAADGAKVPAVPTLALVDEMIAAGAPKARIAEHLGQTSHVLQIGSDFVFARTATAVRDLHRRWMAGEVVFDRRSRWGSHPVGMPPPPAQRGRADVSDLLVELAEIVEERQEQAEWRKDAACRGRPVWMWFPARGDNETEERARRICASCFVRDECRASNMHQRVGIFGGLSAKRRRQLHSEIES